MVEAINEANFAEKITDDLIFIDFWATWCGPCRMQAPIVEQLDEEMPDVTFYKVDIDENPKLAEEFQVMSIPTMIILKDKTVKEVVVGVHQKEQLAQLLNQYR